MSEIPSRQRLSVLCARLGNIYQSLHEASLKFLSETPAVEKLGGLLDQRDFTLEEARDIEREVQDLYSLIASQPQEADLNKIIRFLENGEESERLMVRDLRRSLEALMGSDKAVDEWMNNQKDSLTEELKTVRRGSAMLKGYASSDQVGSCFIDKVK